MTHTLGFAGLGTMGGQMASWLAKKGYNLVVLDPSPTAVAKLTSLGASVATSAKDLADKTDIILCSLPSPQILNDVMLGETGVVHGTRARTVIDLSTSGPRATAQVASLLANASITLVDAPVSGNPQGAGSGKLTLMVSGNIDSIELVRPILETLGPRVVIVGDKPGLGQYMKLVNNFLSASALAASAEAMVMGVKAGLDPMRMLEVLNNGSGKNSATLDKIPNDVLSRRFEHGFAISLLYKDVKLYLDESEALNVPTWVGGAVKQLWQQSQLKSGGAADCTRIFQLIEDWSGVKVSAGKLG
jgi:3-hydroxyisobutyrate dehydrogenase-like beta-hydroxyacid dehydrogenase